MTCSNIMTTLNTALKTINAHFVPEINHSKLEPVLEPGFTGPWK